MRRKIIAFSVAAIVSNGVYAGDIFRCVAANGDVMFTNMGCPTNSRVQHVATYESVPDSPVPTYDTASNVAAASAVEAREAAQQARAAAYQARAVYDEAQNEAQNEQLSDEVAYPNGRIAFYPRFDSRFHNHRLHPQHFVPPMPHAQSAIFSLRH